MTNTHDQVEDGNTVDNQGDGSSKPSNANDFEAIKILLEEYKTLRQESLGSIRLRIQILSFGLAAIVLLFGVPFSSKSGPNIILINIIYTIVIPLVCTIVVDLWLGELLRMERAGNFMYVQEIRINKVINEIKLQNVDTNKHILSWEGWLRGQVNAEEMWPLNNDIVDINIINSILYIDKNKLKITTAYEKSISLFYSIAYGSCVLSIIFPPIFYLSASANPTDKPFNYFDSQFGIISYIIFFIFTLYLLLRLDRKHLDAINEYMLIRKKNENQINLKTLTKLAKYIYGRFIAFLRIPSKNNEKSNKSIIFDIGGVLAYDVWENLLLDEEKGIAKKYNLDKATAKNIGEKLWEEFAYRSGNFEELEREYWNRFISEVGISINIDDLINLTDKFIRTVDNMSSLLSKLKEKGINLAICSNNNEFWFKHQSDKINLSDYFESKKIILSCRIGSSKSSKNFELFKETVKALGAQKEECILVDDRVESIAKANEYGMTGILFPSHSKFGARYLKLLFERMKIL